VAPWWRWIGALGSELLVASTVFSAIFLGAKGLVLSALLLIAFLAFFTFFPKLIPLHRQSVQSFTWPTAHALLLSTAVTFALVGAAVWALISHAA